ncbi:MAG: phosphatidylserine/phosphatidylglycerophosphate/cardiolipin synthase family protein [Myxococcota bacterium]
MTTTVRGRTNVQPAVTPSVTTPAAPSTTTPATTPGTPAETPEAAYTGTGGQPTGRPSGALGGAGTAMLATRLAMTAGAMDPALLAALRTPEGLKAAVEKLSATLVQSNGAAITPQHEKKVFESLAKLHAAGQLVPALTMLADRAAAAGALPGNIPPEKKAGLVQQFAAMIEAEIDARGVSGRPDRVFEDWNALSQKLLAQARNTQVPPAGPGVPSAFTNPTFLKEFESLVGAKLTEGNSIRPLIDGPASFKERDRMIDGATRSIHLLSWAFYDDETGMETARKLIEKKKQGVDVKVMVDGNVARQPGHEKALKLMEEAGIPVVRWNDPDRVHDGQHRKVMIVDGKAAVAGGLNVGNVYSHRGPADGQKWRDTDVLMQGPCVTESAKLFASLWNAQVDAHGLAHAKVEAPQTAPAGTGSVRAAIVDDVPGPQGNSNILLATLKAIEGATKSVDIENAYFISTPAIRDALLKALERGVNVRILTNSAQSVDEPIVSAPILASLPELVEKGAEVYLKKGDTLHSKFLVVDGLFTSVGSYNLHPRSERYEGEVCVAAVDEKLGKEMRAAFEKDIVAAQRVNQASDIQVPKTAFSILASRFFFDQL